MRNVVLVLCIWCASPAFGQSIFGSIVGAVQDPSGAAAVGAEVTARDVDTGFSASTTAGADGLFEFPDLKPGHYLVTASKQGFADSAAADVPLEARRRIRTELS